MRRNVFFKSVTFGLLFLLISATFSSTSTANINKNEESLSFLKQLDDKEQATVTCYAGGFQNTYIQQQQNLSAEEIKTLFTKLAELNSLISK